jgi:hypothetical protein
MTVQFNTALRHNFAMEPESETFDFGIFFDAQPDCAINRDEDEPRRKRISDRYDQAAQDLNTPL